MDGAIEFARAMAGGRAIEVAAVALGLANVALLIRRSIWNYPFGIAMVSLYAVIFLETKLYADAGLQVFFFAIQFYGWWSWLRARGSDGLVVVRRLRPVLAAVYGATALAGSAALGAGLDRLTDAAYPYWDAAIASFSVCAQVMMAKRFLENWLVWIAVDFLAIGLFCTKGLGPTAALYAVFLLMSAAGYLSWRQTLPRRMSAS